MCSSRGLWKGSVAKQRLRDILFFLKELPAVCMQVISGNLNEVLHKWKMTERLVKEVKATYQQYYGEK